MLSSLTWGKPEHATVGVVVYSRLSRSVPSAAADLGGAVQVSTADHFNVEDLDAVRTGRLSDLEGRLLELDGGSWRETVSRLVMVKQNTMVF